MGKVQGGGGRGDGLLPVRHNYVGDEGDYPKLALLRVLATDEALGVNWYLTVHPEDEGTPGGADGKKLAHLERDDDEWLHLDESLLRQMRRSLEQWRRDERHISHLEELLPGATFYGEGLPTGRTSVAERKVLREAWHRTALATLAGADVVFVDPDNGFQVKSHGPGSKWRCKYATYAEVSDYLARGQAVVAYQHRPRVTWQALVEKVRSELRTHAVPTAPPGFIAFGSRGFFLMHPDPERVAQLTARARALKAACDEAGWDKLTIEIIEPGDVAP